MENCFVDKILNVGLKAILMASSEGLSVYERIDMTTKKSQTSFHVDDASFVVPENAVKLGGT